MREKIIAFSATKKGAVALNMSTPFNANRLSATLFGKTRRMVLALLYSHVDESFYFRQIARIAGIGQGAVQRELKNLSEAGIIRRTVRGRLPGARGRTLRQRCRCYGRG